MKRIALVGATGIDWWVTNKKKEYVISSTPPGYEILNYVPRHGTHSVESRTDVAYNAPFILEQVLRAQKDGVDAIVIDCVCDPVLDASREITTVPVVGARKATLHLALTLGTKFSIVTVEGKSLQKCWEHGIRIEALESFCASIRVIKIPVLDIPENPIATQKELLEMCRKIVNEDNADVIVLGCTGLSHEVEIDSIMEELGIPILDPFSVAIQTAVLMVEMGISHSKIAYPSPSRKEINEAPCLEGVFDDSLKE